MSLKLRLARGGAKKRPYYRIVVADSRSPRDGRFIEQIGMWNPLLPKDNAERVKVDAEKAKAWLDKGAQPTDRVARFLSEAGLVEWKAGSNPNKAKPGKKAQERVEERAAKDAAKAEAAAAPAPVKEAPAEEAPAAAAPVKEAPAEEAAAEEAPAEEAPAEEAPAEQAPAEEAPAEEAPAEETPAGA